MVAGSLLYIEHQKFANILYYFKIFVKLVKIQMLQSILAFHQSTNSFSIPITPILNLPKDTYQDYLAFLFENNEELQSDDHSVYLQKAAFDAVIQNFHDEELSILQEKEDMYMYYIMYSTLYNTDKSSHSEFQHNVEELFGFYGLTPDEKLFVEQIEGIVKTTMIKQISPFSYLEACKELFSEKLQLKLIDILKFMIGDSFCYKMNPASIFGVCLKWTIDRYKINNSLINELIAHLIDLNSVQISEKIEKLTQMMDQVINMNPTSTN